jgi:16S rRNA (guanine527-N7)-methyltransferase
MSGRELRDRIRRRARVARAPLTPILLDGLEAYYELLTKWNAVVNLTAFRLEPGGEDQAIDRLLIEPLVAAKHLPDKATHLLDAGSGGGSPAIPVKLSCPRLALKMVEVKTRKAVFLREAVRVLALEQATVETARLEELLGRPELHEAQDVVSVRALRIEPKLLMTLQAFLKPGGHLWLFRGAARKEVAGQIVPPLTAKATYPLVDSLHSRLLILEKVSIGVR